MHEHGSEERHKITEGIGEEAARDERPLPNKSITTTHLDKEKQDVQSDEGIRDQWDSSAGGIVITDWQHMIYPFKKLFPGNVRLTGNGLFRGAANSHAHP